MIKIAQDEKDTRKIANNIVRESLREGLLQLIERKQYDDISVSELTQRAGVSRVSFYRNYDSKDEILLEYLVLTANEAWDNAIKNTSREKWRAAFKVFEALRPVVGKLKLAGKDTLFYEMFKIITNKDKTVRIEEDCQRAVLIGIFTGIFDWWRENGMKENAEELTNRFAEIELANLVAKIR